MTSKSEFKSSLGHVDERALATKRLKAKEKEIIPSNQTLEIGYEKENTIPTQKNVTLLMRSGREACVIALGSYIILQYAIFTNRKSNSAVCQAQLEYSASAKQVALVSSIMFLVGCILQIYQVCVEGLYLNAFTFCGNSDASSKFVLYLTTFTVMFIAGSSCFLTYSYNWGGICEDHFGVISPASQWPEWLTTVPLLVYISLSIDTKKKKLFKKDVVVIVSMGLCIASGFIMQTKLPRILSYFILFCSNFCVLATILMIHREYDEVEKSSGMIGPTNTERETIRITNTMKTKTLTYLLFIIFPIFPAIYLFAFHDLLDYNQTYIAYQIAGLCAKLFFTALAVRSHRSVLDLFVSLLDEEIQPMIQTVVHAMDIEDWTSKY